MSFNVTIAIYYKSQQLQGKPTAYVILRYPGIQVFADEEESYLRKEQAPVSMPADQIDGPHDTSAFLGFIGQCAFEPCLGAVCEFVAVREHPDRLDLCRGGKVIGQMVRVGLFMASHAASYLARARVHVENANLLRQAK